MDFEGSNSVYSLIVSFMIYRRWFKQGRRCYKKHIHNHGRYPQRRPNHTLYSVEILQHDYITVKIECILNNSICYVNYCNLAILITRTFITSKKDIDIFQPHLFHILKKVSSFAARATEAIVLGTDLIRASAVTLEVTIETKPAVCTFCKKVKINWRLHVDECNVHRMHLQKRAYGISFVVFLLVCLFAVFFS